MVYARCYMWWFVLWEGFVIILENVPSSMHMVLSYTPFLSPWLDTWHFWAHITWAATLFYEFDWCLGVVCTWISIFSHDLRLLWYKELVITTISFLWHIILWSWCYLREDEFDVYPLFLPLGLYIPPLFRNSALTLPLLSQKWVKINCAPYCFLYYQLGSKYYFPSLFFVLPHFARTSAKSNCYVDSYIPPTNPTLLNWNL
jgi:hypothetical protein